MVNNKRCTVWLSDNAWKLIDEAHKLFQEKTGYKVAKVDFRSKLIEEAAKNEIKRLSTESD